jgi:hypothetical protein
MATKRLPQRRMSTADRKVLEKVLATLERARDVINDPATPETKVVRIGAILEAFKYGRPLHAPPEVVGFLNRSARPSTENHPAAHQAA